MTYERSELQFEPRFGAGECRRDQRRLQALTLPVTYTRVRDKAVGMYKVVVGMLDGEAEGVEEHPVWVELGGENAVAV